MKRAALLTLVLLAACGRPFPVPLTGPHVGDEPVPVPSPPPPGKVEIITKRPPELKNPVWVDGEWQWTGRRWVWKDGSWQDGSQGDYYAPSTTVRLADGSIVLFKGAWKKKTEPSK